MNRSWQLPLNAPPQLFMLGLSEHYPVTGYDCYRLPGLWCLHFYRYNGVLRINGESFPIRPNSCSVTPPGAVLEYAYHDAPSHHAVAHFRFEAGDGSEETNGKSVMLPAMRDLGGEFEGLASAFEAAIPWQITQPARSSSRVWEVLWRLGELEEQSKNVDTPTPHAAIERARREIEMRLGTALRVEDIAERAGFSHNHFTRLFYAAVGNTPAQYIRARRVERASHLLKHSTLPVKAIATQCGLGDLQAFNKTIRRELKMSPRELRKL